MLTLSIAMRQEEAKSLILDLYPEIRFIKKEGMNLLFDAPLDKDYASLVKKALKADHKFSALYFSITSK